MKSGVAEGDANAPEFAVVGAVGGLVGEGVVLGAELLGAGHADVEVVAVEEELAAGFIDEEAEVDVSGERVVVADVDLCRESADVHGAGGDGQAGIDDEEADAGVDEEIGGLVDELVEPIHGDRIESVGVDGGSAMAEPYDVLASGLGSVLDGDLLEVLDGLGEALGVEGAIHLFVWQGSGDMPEGEEEVVAAAGEALDQLHGVVADDHELGGGGKLARLAEEVEASFVAEIG